ncbi:hypothetical protein QOZ80_8BG0654040 [Eleusine coracana subsp. coracana]|nr:hypothetical protein QOZ80_8BG0654040 [Eleusine coracana subsp. coracana]
MHKTRSAVQGTVDKATAHNASEQVAAGATQQERIRAAEAEKQDAMRTNAAAKERATYDHRRRARPASTPPKAVVGPLPLVGTSRAAWARPGSWPGRPAPGGPAPRTTRSRELDILLRILCVCARRP